MAHSRRLPAELILVSRHFSDKARENGNQTGRQHHVYGTDGQTQHYLSSPAQYPSSSAYFPNTPDEHDRVSRRHQYSGSQPHQAQHQQQRQQQQFQQQHHHQQLQQQQLQQQQNYQQHQQPPHTHHAHHPARHRRQTSSRSAGHYGHHARASIGSDNSSAPDLVDDRAESDVSIEGEDEEYDVDYQYHAAVAHGFDSYWQTEDGQENGPDSEEDILNCYLDMPAIAAVKESHLLDRYPDDDDEEAAEPDSAALTPRQHRRQAASHTWTAERFPSQSPSPSPSPKRRPAHRRHKTSPSYSLFPKPTLLPPPRTTSLTNAVAVRKITNQAHYDSNGNVLVSELPPPAFSQAPAMPPPPPRPSTANNGAQPAPPQHSVFEYDSDEQQNQEGQGQQKGLARLVRGLHMRSASESRRTARGAGVAAQQLKRARAGTVSAGASFTSTVPAPSSAAADPDVKKRQGGDVFGRLLGRW